MSGGKEKMPENKYDIDRKIGNFILYSFLFLGLCVPVVMGITGFYSHKDRTLMFRARRIKNYIAYKLFVFNNDNKRFPESINELIKKQYIQAFKEDELKRIRINYTPEKDNEGFELTVESDGVVSDFTLEHDHKFDPYINFFVKRTSDIPETTYVSFRNDIGSALDCSIHTFGISDNEKEKLRKKLEEIEQSFRLKFKTVNVEFNIEAYY